MTQTIPTQQQTKVYLSYSEIGGRSWSPIGDRTYIRSIAPGQKAPPEAHVVTPDCRKPHGWRLAWIFLKLSAIPLGAYLGLKLWLFIQPHLVYALLLPVGVA